MPDEDDYFAEDEESSEPEGEEFGAARAELERRCEGASIRLVEKKSPFEEGKKYLRVDLPAGREKRGYHLWNAEIIRALLSVPFEEYVFLIPYEAICSYERGSIEALVSSLGRMPFPMVRRLFLGKGRGEDVEEEEIDFSLPSPDGRFSVSLSPTSTHLKTLIPRSIRSKLSLRINGLHVQRHTAAVDILRRVSDSLFFQIDLSKGIAFTLARERHRPILRRRRLVAKPIGDLQFPIQEYDEVPMSLYWYARSAFSMPLLQFLAYYQTIEFYFPTYYQAEAYRKIRRILKDPAFRADRDADIGRVLSSLTTRGTTGNERSMIRATFQECVDPDELRAFLLSDNYRKEFFSSKTKGLTSAKLPLANPAADLRNDVTDRIYEIRCKIVHTKSDTREGEIRLLLPFSKEVDQLYYDIDLVQYLAQQVLITASTSLHM